MVRPTHPLPAVVDVIATIAGGDRAALGAAVADCCSRAAAMPYTDGDLGVGRGRASA